MLSVPTMCDAATDTTNPQAVEERISKIRAALSTGDAATSLTHALRLLDAARADGDAALECEALIHAAAACSAVDDVEGTVRWLEQARPLAEQSSDAKRNFDIDNLLGNVLATIEEFERSFEASRRSIDTALAAGNEHWQRIAQSNLASRWIGVGERERKCGSEAKAREAFNHCVTLCRPLLVYARSGGHLQMEFAALANLGSALQQLGQGDEALVALLHSDALAERAGMVPSRANTALYKARLAAERGDIAAARRAAHEGLDIGRIHDNRMSCAELHGFLCELEEREGNVATALAHCRSHHLAWVACSSQAAADRSCMLAVQLRTERALADAAAERAKTYTLSTANQRLLAQAEVLTEQAQQDPLTGLANRRRLDAQLALQHADAVSRAVPLCVAMVDLDHFKRINDAHSHAVGDAVLHRVGLLLQTQCRGGDIAARYGGEEFVVLLNNVGLPRALVICERVRQVIEAFEWAGIAPGLTVTASIGVCDIALAASPAAGLTVADKLLYQAKTQGRNRVVGAA